MPNDEQGERIIAKFQELSEWVKTFKKNQAIIKRFGTKLSGTMYNDFKYTTENIRRCAEELDEAMKG